MLRSALRVQLGPATRGYSSSAPQEVYDVTIVGAGMVGAALSALLAHNPFTAALRVAILDQQAPPLHKQAPSFPDARVSTVTAANVQMLEQARAWSELASPACAPFRHMQVWEHAGSGTLRWDAAELGQEVMGVVAENWRLQAALLRSALNAPGSQVELLHPASVTSLHIPGVTSQHQQQQQRSGPVVGPNPTSSSSSSPDSSEDPSTSGRDSTAGAAAAEDRFGLAQLQLADGRCLRSRLVVAADGARSQVRAMAGLRTISWPYHQRGLVATVSTATPNDTAWQRFLPTGPLALLPVRDGYSNIVWTLTPELAVQMEQYSPQQLADAINASLQEHPTWGSSSSSSFPLAAAGQVLGSLLPGGGSSSSSSGWQAPPLVEGWVGHPPKSFPLQMQHAGRYTTHRLALIGDAAHAVHPLAGQGLNLGLGDAACLAEALASAKQVGRDIGEPTFLREHYDKPRQHANLQMMAALEGLQRVFGVTGGPGLGGTLAGLFGTARSMGVGALNAAGPLKNRIMKYAMGL